MARPVIDTIKFAYESLTYLIRDASVCIHYIGTVVHQHVENVIEDIRDVSRLKQNAKDMLKLGIEETQRSLREMQRLILEKLNVLDSYVNEVKRRVEEFFEPCLDVLDDFIVYVEQRLAVIQLILLGKYLLFTDVLEVRDGYSNFADILDTIQSYIVNLQEMQDMLRSYSIYFSWLEELHVMDLLEPVGNVVECILEEIMDDLRKVYEDYRPYIEALYNALFGRYEQLVQLPPISEIRRFYNHIYQKTLWFWKYHNLSETIKSYTRDFFTNIDDFLIIMLELENLSGEDLDTVFQNADYIYRPEQGHIECSIPLVVEWRTFDTFPEYEQHSLYQKIQKKLNRLRELQGYLVELAYSLRSATGFTLRTELSPSVNNYAMIVGKTHFITFDGYHYNVSSGEGSYVLAGDFKTNFFSITVNYEFGEMKSISVNSYDATVELMTSSDVVLNGKTTDLPIILNSTTVTRDYKTVTIKNSRGLRLTYDYRYDIWTVELSRWLFGKTGGLLGTLDNERVTDLIFPDGTKTTDVARFIESWKVSGDKTETVHSAVEQRIELTPLEEELTGALCNALFAYRNSPLSDCFHRVDPKPFLDICLGDVRRAANRTACSSLVAYFRLCDGFNIPVKIPEMCGK